MITISLALDVIPNLNISDLVIDSSKRKTPHVPHFTIPGMARNLSLIIYIYFKKSHILVVGKLTYTHPENSI